MATTTTPLQPSTNSELQLYRVLQRANLLQYFETFITQGGDDVQQLCEAGEDEFLEIMALVGMASKPLHVRRLQKALQEWVANPTAFDVPKKFPTIVMSMAGGGGAGVCGSRPGSTPSPMSSTEASLSPAHSIPCSLAEPQNHLTGARPNMATNNNNSSGGGGGTPTPVAQTSNPTGRASSGVASNHADLYHAHKGGPNAIININNGAASSSLLLDKPTNISHPSASPIAVLHAVSSSNCEPSPPWALQTRGPTPPEAAVSSSGGSRRGRGDAQGGVLTMQLPTDSTHPSPPDSPQEFKDVIKDGVYNPNDAAYIPTVSHPVLMEHQISAIAAAAAILARDLPPIEPKSLPKKQNSKDITTVMMMSGDDPNRLDAMRKYAAIYGRFDSKRKNHRPMSLHEISVNEAAAQLCNHFPALLTRREELFPLARQVVRDSGYQYSKGHSSRPPPKMDVGYEYECPTGLPRYYDRAAEVLVQPKLEPVESLAGYVSASSGGAVAAISPEEETYNDMQNELAHITLSLSEMDKEQARIRAALRVLLEANDLEQVRGLTAEMDVLNDRQEAMAKRRQRIVTALSRYKKGGFKTSGGCDRVNLSFKQQPSRQGNKKNFNSIISGGISNINTINNNNNNNKVTNSNILGAYNNSPFSNGNGGGNYPGSTGNTLNAIANTPGNTSVNGGVCDSDGPITNPLNTLYLAAMQNQRDSLFEEGLRIATQYGMSEFAKELIGMKTQGKVLGSDDSGTSSMGMSTSGFVPQSTAASLTAAAPSSLFTASIASASSPAVTAAPSPMVAAVSSDNISASSSEYLSPASACHIHTPPSLMAVSVSAPASSASSALSSSSPASLLFPSSVIATKQTKSSKSSNKRPCDNSSPAISSSASSAKSPRTSDCNDTILASTALSPAASRSSPSPISSSSSSSSVAAASTATAKRLQISKNQEMNNTTTLSSTPVAAAATTAITEQQGSTTTTTTITTKSGQVIEVETRRSSRRKNGEPDYYLINGGEKRFRSSSSGSSGSAPITTSPNFSVGSSPSGRRGSSGDKRKLSVENPTSISSPSKPYTLEPCNTSGGKNNALDGDLSSSRAEMSDMRLRNAAGEIHKVRMGFQQRIEPSDRDNR